MLIIVFVVSIFGNWFLLNNELAIGYWPSTLFNKLNTKAERVVWGKEMTTCVMGSGYVPGGGFVNLAQEDQNPRDEGEMDIEGWIASQEDKDDEMNENTMSKTITKKRARNQEKPKVWDNFTKINGSDPPRAKCNYCPKTFACHSVINGTSTLRAHMLTRCFNNPHRTTNVGSKQSILTFKPNDGGGKDLVPTIFSEDACREALAKMIILDEHSFKSVEGEGFLNFCRLAVPMFKVPCRTTVARDCLALYSKEKKKLKNALKGKRICITTDTWTSIQNINYMCVTAHYISSDWILTKKILSFGVIPNHKGETIGKMIEKCLLEWGVGSVFTVTCDNAASNNVAIECLKKKTKHRKHVVLQHDFIHVRCSAHVLNIIVRGGLNQFDESIHRVRDAVRYVRSSPSRWAKWKKCVNAEKIDSKKHVCLDVATRWNSTYMMLETALKYEKAFERMEDDDEGYRLYFSNIDEVEENEDGEEVEVEAMVGAKDSRKKRIKVSPKAEDWARVGLFVQFLEVYFKTTNKISGSKYVTSDILFNELVRVHCNLKKLCDSLDDGLRGIGKKMYAKFDKYWRFDKINPLLLVAVVLDPRFKMGYLPFGLKKLYSGDKSKIDKIIEKVKKTLLDLYEWYEVNNRSSDGAISPQNVGGLVVGIDLEDIASEWKMLNTSESWGSKSEVDKYLESPVEEETKGKAFEILGWWRSNASRYPILSLVAQDVLAVPVTSVASESAFSTGGRVIDPFRSSLRPNTIEALICTQDWLTSTAKPIDLQASMREIQEYDEIDAEIFEATTSSLSSAADDEFD